MPQKYPTRKMAQAQFEAKSKFEGNTTKLSKKGVDAETEADESADNELDNEPRVSPYIMYFLLFVLVISSVAGALEVMKAGPVF